MQRDAGLVLMPDFLPRQDGKLERWARRFADRAGESPEQFGLSPEQLDAFTQAHDLFAGLLSLTKDRGTRTALAIQRKDSARKALVTLARQLSMAVRSNKNVSDGQRISLGLRADNRSRSRISAPRVAPLIQLIDVNSVGIKLRLRVPGTAAPLAKPKGVTSATVLIHFGDDWPTKNSKWDFLGITGRTITTMPLRTKAPAGSKFWVIARWHNYRGAAGPFSGVACGLVPIVRDLNPQSHTAAV